MRYVDRADAGRHLAGYVRDGLTSLPSFADEGRPLVLGVPRGGVIVAAPVAVHLGGELDVALARKIGAPDNPELAIGAVGESGEPYLSHRLIMSLGLSDDSVRIAAERARAELERRAVLYRVDRPPAPVADRVVIVVDDGVATGATLRATLRTVHSQSPRTLVCAVPVGPPAAVEELAAEVDLMVCPQQPRWFRAVGEWYETFTQTTDREVIETLRQSG